MKRRVHGSLSFCQSNYLSIHWSTIFVSHSRGTGTRSSRNFSSLEFTWFQKPGLAQTRPIARKSYRSFDQEQLPPEFHTLSIIIPVYNERPTVMKLLRQVARNLSACTKNSSSLTTTSTDGTREFLQPDDLEGLLG